VSVFTKKNSEDDLSITYTSKAIISFTSNFRLAEECYFQLGL
jgi:hypothetical protein